MLQHLLNCGGDVCTELAVQVCDCDYDQCDICPKGTQTKSLEDEELYLFRLNWLKGRTRNNVCNSVAGVLAQRAAAIDIAAGNVTPREPWR
jgi:hypothetical protein